MEHMAIYNAVRAVPEIAKKRIAGGAYGKAGLTDVNPQWRIEMLTNQFGPCGTGWKFEVVRTWTETLNALIEDDNGAKSWRDVQTMYAEIALRYRYPIDDYWSEPIPGFGGTKLQYYNVDDALKSTITDAISNACRYIGVGADVWYSKGAQQFDTKYSTNPGAEKTEEKPAKKADTPIAPMQESDPGYWRGKALQELRRLNLNYTEVMVKHGMTKDSSPELWMNLYTELSKQ